MNNKQALRVPAMSQDLIAKLDKLYPERCATRDQNQFDIAYYAGIRAVVVTLAAWQDMDTADATGGDDVLL
jgi:hypothetical protein